MNQPPLGIVVLISGRGSNLQAIIDARESIGAEIKAVISNRPNAAGLARAERAGIPALTLDHKTFPDRESFDRALAEFIDRYNPGLVVLAGFMRLLTPTFVAHYEGRLINIHPSLLPDFPGLDTHQRAIDAGVSEHGATVHFVTDELDGGPIILRGRVPLRHTDDAERLAARVLEQEHIILPKAIKWFGERRLTLRGNSAFLDGEAVAE